LEPHDTVKTWTVTGFFQPMDIVGVVNDDIELVATGGTVLRYDAAAGQFAHNWQTPSGQAGPAGA
jgi:hypothetical protein